MDVLDKNKDQLIEKLAAQRKVIEVSTQIIQALHTDQTAEDALLQVGNILQEVIPYDSLRIRLHEVDQRYFFAHGTIEREGVDAGNWTRLMNPVNSAMGWVLAHKQPLLRTNIAQDLRYEYDPKMIERGILSNLVIPLVVDDDIIGVLNFEGERED